MIDQCSGSSCPAEAGARPQRIQTHGKTGSIGAKIGLPVVIAFTLLCVAWTVYLSAAWATDTRVPTTMLMHLSWDEYQYLPHIHSLQTHLLNGDVRAFFSDPENFGYGDLFWQVYAIADLPFAKLLATDNDWGLIWMRYVTLIFQLGSVALSILLVKRLTHPARMSHAAIALVLILAPMPGLMLLYKPFSPDYLSNFLMLLGLLLAHDSQAAATPSRGLWRCALAALCSGAGIATKTYNGLLLPLFAACIFGYTFPKARQWPRGLVAVGGGIAGMLASNSSLFFTGPGPFVAKFKYLASAMNSDSFQHAIKPPGLGHRIAAWWSNPATTSLVGINTAGIGREFFSAWGLVLLLGVSVFMFWRRQRREPTEMPKGFVFLCGGLLALALTVLLTNRVWTWYVICPVFVVAIGLATTGTLFLSGDRNLRLLPATAVAAHVLLIAPWWYRKFDEFSHNRSIQVAEYRAYVEDVVRPYRTLVASLPHGSIIANYRAPIEPIVTGWLLWSDDVRSFLSPGTRLISLRYPTAADRACFLKHGFTEHAYPGGYSVFLAAGVHSPY